MEEKVCAVSGGEMGPLPEDTLKQITRACKDKRLEEVKTLVSSLNEEVGTRRKWNYTDEDGHGAVYYGIRSSNVELLTTLLTLTHEDCKCENRSGECLKSPELDKLLSVPFDELKLKNVLIEDEMKLFVENILVKLRFFSKDNELPATQDKGLIQQRLLLIIDNISTLTTEYSDKKIDSRFICIAKFIAQNMHISKQQLKSTYSSVPWEEIEFCLVRFISAHTEIKEVNFFYLSVLRKGALLERLADFSLALRDLIGFIHSSNVFKLNSRVRSSREKVVEGIINKYPRFQSLYTDYKVARDIYSLDIMKSSIKSALPADPTTRDGQLTIKRALQVLGEYLKDTLDSPNLSTAVSDLLLSLAPKQTRDILKNLRNSISHVHFNQNDNNIEDSKLYSNILNDIKKIATVISDINNFSKIEVLKQLISDKFMNLEYFEEILRNLNQFPKSKSNQDITTKEHQNVEDSIEEIRRLVPDITPSEDQTLTNILELNKSKNKKKLHEDVFKMMQIFYSLNIFFQHTTSSRRKADYLDKWRKLNFPSDNTIHPSEYEFMEWFTKLGTLAKNFHESVSLRILPEVDTQIHFLLFKIQFLLDDDKHTINWLDEYKMQLSLHKNHDKDAIGGKDLFEGRKDNKDVLDKLITLHLNELAEALGTGRSHHASHNLFPLVQKNKHNKLRIEALLLDTMSLLEERTKCLSNNWLYLDDNMPLLSGRVLRNYLAHGNPLVDNILSRDTFSTVILNTMILTEPDMEEILILNNVKVGKMLTPDMNQLEQKFVESLESINKQEAMCQALVEGNLEGLQTCLREGADLYSRSLIDCSTTLHTAAKGTSVEMVKMLFENNICPALRDINGQTPLHIAAAFGREAIVQYLVEETSVSIDQLDTTGKTPQHVAALNGHTETVVKLLSLGANASIKDGQGFSTLYYAAVNNFIELVKVLFDVDTAAMVDDRDCTLHIAAEHGHAELVQYLLDKGADVNNKSHQGLRPLHRAAANGHQNVVINLIKQGAFVNLHASDGSTPLHMAILNEHEGIVNILLEKGAFIEIVHKQTGATPLHSAIQIGYKRIVEIILENNANVNALNENGKTPLLSAVVSGNLNIVKLLLKAGAQLDIKDADGMSALHISAMYGHNDIVTYLIKQDVVIDARTTKQKTPLHLAAFEGHRETVDILLAVGANVCSVCERGLTPLHMSAIRGHAVVSELLIMKGSNVNSKCKLNRTPLHWAVKDAFNEKIVQLLLEKGTNVEEVDEDNFTALHLASFQGYNSVVKALIDGKADVCAENTFGHSALLLAVLGNHITTANVLLDHGADVNASNSNVNLLCAVARMNNKELLNILVAKGADIKAQGGKALAEAITGGHMQTFEALLKRKELDVHVNVDGPYFLQVAAARGHWQIGRALIKRGVNVNSISNSFTALLMAVRAGHKEFVEVLLEHGADVNLTIDGLVSPLHLAAALDHPDIVEFLLLKGAKHDALDKDNNTPIHLAIFKNQLNNLICFFKHCNVDINAVNSDGFSLLHHAARVGNFEVVKYLLDQGADLNARESSGFKAIHQAACMGHIELVELFLERGMNIGDLGASGITLLHCAAISGHTPLVQYLIDKHADVNAVDVAGKQTIHYVARKGYKELVITLLSNGAMYEATDDDGRTPLELTSEADIRELIQSVGDLFKAINENSVSKAENLIKVIGKPIEAKDTDNCSVLHLASKKGFQQICDHLLLNGADPNVVGNGGKTPLHFASEFSHLEIVVSLLQNGAVYNVECENRKTPLDLATQENTLFLLKLVEDCFKKAQNRDIKVIEHIFSESGDIGIIKAVLKSRNTQGSTLVDVATQNNFPEIDSLYEILQDRFSLNLTEVKGLLKLDHFTEALSILRNLLIEREHLLGRDDLGTLLIKQEIPLIFYDQFKISDCLSIFKEIYDKGKIALGQNNQLSLWARSQIALALLRQGQGQEASEMFDEVIPKQKDFLGEDHINLLQTKTQCLDKLDNFDEASDINNEILGKLQSSGNTRLTLDVRSNIVSILGQQGRLEEYLNIIKKVHEERKHIYGINHSRTLRAQGQVAQVLRAQGKTAEALGVYREVYAIQKIVLGPNHLDTLHTCTNIVNAYIRQHRIFEAQKFYKEGLEHRDSLINDPVIIALDSYFKELKEYTMIGGYPFTYTVSFQNSCEMDIIVAASTGDITLVESLIRHGSDVNTADTDGRTPLHFAASGGHFDIVKLLLKSGADATATSVKGNTALHGAALRGCVCSVGTLLQTVKRVKARAYDDFINAQTIVGGASALHVAAKRGLVEIVKCLLEHGAIYCCPDRSNGHTPLQCSGSQAVTSILELAQEMFDFAERGQIPQISTEKQEYLLVVLASTDMQGRTPVQVARFHNHHSVVAFFECARQTNITLN